MSRIIDQYKEIAQDALDLEIEIIEQYERKQMSREEYERKRQNLNQERRDRLHTFVEKHFGS